MVLFPRSVIGGSFLDVSTLLSVVFGVRIVIPCLVGINQQHVENFHTLTIPPLFPSLLQKLLRGVSLKN